VLSRALHAAAEAAKRGEHRASALVALVREMVAREPLVEVEYIEVRDPRELSPVDVIESPALLALAARVGATRLIDNMEIMAGTGADLCNAR
jgi:pantothenate synthetase